jgi:hypothetical protein
MRVKASGEGGDGLSPLARVPRSKWRRARASGLNWTERESARREASLTLPFSADSINWNPMERQFRLAVFAVRRFFP